MEFSLQQVLVPKLLYPLTTTNFSKEQCYTILKPILASALPAMGINWHFLCTVVHGPKSYQGLDILNLFTEQICTHIATLLWFGCQHQDPTGHLLHINAEAFRLEAGLAGEILCMPISIHDYMTPSWLTAIWYQCKLLEIEISNNVWDFETPRQGDTELMQIFLKHGLHGYKLASMNWCQMFLKAIFFSDICTRDSTAIDPQFWNGQIKCNLDLIWPRTETPPISDWGLWKKHLTAALALGQKDTLQKLLGNWAHHQGQINGFFLEKDSEHLFQRQQEKWFIYTKIPSWQRQLNFHNASWPVTEHNIPHNCWRAQIRRTQHTITITRAAPIDMKKQPMTTGNDLLKGQWGIQHEIQGSREQLAEAIHKEIAIAVSNGSFQSQQGAAAWMIEGYNKNNQILGKGSTPGLPADQSAYHSELFGLWGIFKALQQFCQEIKIQSGHVWVTCNGLSALQQAQSRKPVDPVASHYHIDYSSK